MCRPIEVAEGIVSVLTLRQLALFVERIASLSRLSCHVLRGGRYLAETLDGCIVKRRILSVCSRVPTPRPKNMLYQIVLQGSQTSSMQPGQGQVRAPSAMLSRCPRRSRKGPQARSHVLSLVQRRWTGSLLRGGGRKAHIKKAG